MLLKDKQFFPLMWTQFCGALNDNILKNALIMLITFKGIQLWGMRAEVLVSFATLIFILPFFLFSAMAGVVSDRYQKHQIIKAVKLFEIIIMLLAAVGFHYELYSLLLFVLFLMGLHSTFFGPVKYSSLPELVSTENLTEANAYIEVGTFIAILIGTITGGHFISLDHGVYYIIAILLVVSVIGYALSLLVPKLYLKNDSLKISANPFPSTWEILKQSRSNVTVFNSILGISWFWFVGAVILSLLPTITTKVINGNEHVVTLFLSMFTIGIAIGAILCEKLSFKRVEIGLVPFGSLGMSVFLIDLSFVISSWPGSTDLLTTAEFLSMNGAYRMLVDLLGVAIFGGLFTVPLYTFIQQRSAPEFRSRTIGSNNIMNAFFMVIGSALLMLFLKLEFSIAKIILIFSVTNIAVAIYIYFLVPEFTLRFVSWLLARCFYKMKVTNHNLIPENQAAILTCNHVSFVDWLVIAAMIKRPVKFVMYYKFASIPIFKYLMKDAGVIPIAGKNEDEKIFNRAFEKISESLNQGDLVCIFPEGSITKDGKLLPFKKGIEHILLKNPVPVVPMALKGLWGSIFSHKDARAFTKLPKKIWFRVELAISKPIPPDQVKVENLQFEIQKLLDH